MTVKTVNNNPLSFQEDILRGQTSKVTTASEALEVLETLEQAMFLMTGCMGLAAPQIGIQKSVAIIRHKNIAIDLINPTITSGEGIYLSEREGCMSYPGRKFNAERFSLINVEFDSVWSDTACKEGKVLSPCQCVYRKHDLPSDARLVRQKACFSTHQSEDVYGGIVCVAVQHEIDHLSGIVLPYREKTKEILGNILLQEKIGRNNQCPCGSGKKYKKCCMGKKTIG